MARLILDRDDLAHNPLPPICMKCGRPSVTVVRKHFQWCPGWTIALLFAGVLPYLIVSLVTTKYALVPAPMCNEHRNHWLSRTLFIIGGLLTFIALLVVTLVLASTGGMGVFLLISIVGMFAVLVAGAILTATAIRTIEITDREVTLVKVHPEFVDAYEEELYEAGLRARPRRRRKSRVIDMDFCPSCGELIRSEASHCRFCGGSLSRPGRDVEPRI